VVTKIGAHGVKTIKNHVLTGDHSTTKNVSPERERENVPNLKFTSPSPSMPPWTPFTLETKQKICEVHESKIVGFDLSDVCI
jgi:hypothetical protein